MTGCAIPLQKTHGIAFERRRLYYPWHRWYDRDILTRPAGGAHADTAYFCKAPEAPVDAMLVEVPQWMFDAAQCAAMRMAEFPYVDCPTLRLLKDAIAEQRASVRPAVLKPQLSRQAGHGDTDGNDSKTTSNAVGAVWRTPRRTAVARSRRSHARGGGQDSGTAPTQPERKQPKSRASQSRRAR